MRKQQLADLHDFLDVHRNLDAFLGRLRSTVKNGFYRPVPAEIIRLEKRDGISRRIPLPAPADVLLLQTIVRAIESEVLAKQPTKNAYYSRLKSSRSIEDVDESFPYEWWRLWPQFQKRIWEFSRTRKFVVVTDVANYYDSVPLTALRNVLASLGTFSETLLDFLFYMLEAFVWRPFYIPPTGVGLPQINLDAPRLLAHVYLYTADKELNAATNGDFVRWMDDIDFGTDSVADAREILGKLENSLNSIGLRLNTGKTRILNTTEAVRYFWISENRALTVLDNVLKSGAQSPASINRVVDQLKARFRRFERSERIGHWDKIYKRYFTILGKLGHPYLTTRVPDLLREVPTVRDAIYRYYLHLGYSPRRFNVLEQFVTHGDAKDDAAIFAVLHLISQWRLPRTGIARKFAIALAVASGTASTASVAAVLGGLYVLAKYAGEAELQSYIDATEKIWTKSEWAGRQIAAVLPRLNQPAREQVIHRLSTNGLLEGLRVTSHLEELSQRTSMDTQLRSYLLHVPVSPYPYSLQKVLLALTLVHGRLSDNEKTELRSKIPKISKDLVYRELLLSH